MQEKTMKSKVIKAQAIIWLGTIVSAAVLFYLPHGPAPKNVFMLFPIMTVMAGSSIWTLNRVDIVDPDNKDDSPTDDS